MTVNTVLYMYRNASAWKCRGITGSPALSLHLWAASSTLAAHLRRSLWSETARTIPSSVDWATTRRATSCSSRMTTTKWCARYVCATAPATCATCTEPHTTLTPYILSVCHMSDSDTLLVCSSERVPNREGCQLAGGTEPRRKRVARGAARADRTNWKHVLRAEWLASARRPVGLHVTGAVPSGERPDSHRAPLPHRRARRVQTVQRDERQRHARGDVTRERRVGARESTARRPARGTRAHPVAEAKYTPVARRSTARRTASSRTISGNLTSSNSNWGARVSNAAANSSPPASESMCTAGVQWASGSQSLIGTHETCCFTRWIGSKQLIRVHNCCWLN